MPTVPRTRLGSIAATVCAGENEKNNSVILTFQDLVRQAQASFPRGSDEEFDVVDEQRDAGSIPVAAYSRRIPDRVAETSSCHIRDS